MHRSVAVRPANTRAGRLRRRAPPVARLAGANRPVLSACAGAPAAASSANTVSRGCRRRYDAGQSSPPVPRAPDAGSTPCCSPVTSSQQSPASSRRARPTVMPAVGTTEAPYRAMAACRRDSASRTSRVTSSGPRAGLVEPDVPVHPQAEEREVEAARRLVVGSAAASSSGPSTSIGTKPPAAPRSRSSSSARRRTSHRAGSPGGRPDPLVEQHDSRCANETSPRRVRAPRAPRTPGPACRRSAGRRAGPAAPAADDEHGGDRPAHSAAGQDLEADRHPAAAARSRGGVTTPATIRST